MKKVVIQKEEKIEKVDINDVTSDLYYGTVINGQRCPMSCKSYRDEKRFCFICPTGFTYQNAYWEGTLEEIISTSISRGNPVYQFDTAKELFAWLAE